MTVKKLKVFAFVKKDFEQVERLVVVPERKQKGVAGLTVKVSIIIPRLLFLWALLPISF